MITRYYVPLKTLLIRARPRLTETHDLEFKNCFGAVAGYVHGEIFISSGWFGIALKLPPKMVAQLLDLSGAKLLKYFPKGRIKKEYVVIPDKLIEDSYR